MLLVVLILGDPGEINIRSNRLRALSIALVSVLVVTTTVWTARLIDSLIDGDPWTNSARELIVGAAAVWVASNIAFALLYWDLDSGGAAARAHGLPPYPDLAFPQQMKEEIAPPHWRPKFIDYLYLGFTNATAFSHRRHATGAVGEDRDDGTVADLTHHPRARGRPGCERVQLEA